MRVVDCSKILPLTAGAGLLFLLTLCIRVSLNMGLFTGFRVIEYDSV